MRPLVGPTTYTDRATALGRAVPRSEVRRAWGHAKKAFRKPDKNLILEHAADGCRDFNQSRMAGFVVEELQADEIRAFVGDKTRPTWIFVGYIRISQLTNCADEAVS